MSNQFPNNTIAMFFFCMILYGKGNITYAVTCNRFFNSFEQRFFCDTYQLCHFLTGSPIVKV